jgi:hypothetical protein
LLKQLDDLEQSILHYTEAILLPPPWDRGWPNIAQKFFSVALLLGLRAAHTNQPDDARRAVIYLRYLCGQHPEAFNISPDVVKEYLVRTLGLQIMMELGDVMQDIEEMADLFLELLDSDIWTISTDTISSFVVVIKFRHGKWGKGKEPPAKVIDCLRKAKIRLPDSDELTMTFARTLLNRFWLSHSNDDYEEGTAALDKILTSHASGNETSQYREAVLIIAVFTQIRLTTSGKPEHLE